MPSLFRNTFYTSLTQGWQMLMALVLFKAATKGFGEVGFGKYVLATTLMYFIFLFDDFGLNTLVTREIAKNKNQSRKLLGSAIGIKLLLIPVSLIFITLFFIFKQYDAETNRVIWIFSLYGLTSSFTQLAFGVFRAHERMEYEALVAVTEKTLSTALSVLVVVLGLGLIPFALLFVAAGGISLLFALWILKKRIHPPAFSADLSAGLRLLKKSSAFGCAMFVTYIYGYVAIPMLSWMKNMGAVGFYGAAQKLLSFTNLVPTIFATAFFPRFVVTAHDNAELSRVFTLGLKYLLMLAIPIIPGVFILSERLILLFSDASFGEAAKAMKILSIAASINFINLFLASFYGATNHQRTLLYFEIGALLCNVLCNWLLISKYSYMGAAWATLITEGLMFFLSLGWALGRIVRITEFVFVYKIVFASGIMAAFLIGFPNIALIPTVFAAVALYFTVLFLVKAMSIGQIKTQLIGLR